VGIACPAIDPHPLAALHSRCSASAFLAPRTAAEGRLCSPFQGEVTERVARADSISTETALVPGLCVPAAMRAMIKTVHLSARRFIDDGWLPMVLFAAVMLAAFLER
jgi:hypothetical protein